MYIDMGMHMRNLQPFRNHEIKNLQGLTSDLIETITQTPPAGQKAERLTSQHTRKINRLLDGMENGYVTIAKVNGRLGLIQTTRTDKYTFDDLEDECDDEDCADTTED